MSRALLTLSGPAIRARAHAWIEAAPEWTRVEFKGPKRTVPQNDRMWAMLTDIAAQKEWHGQKRTTDQWKQLFLDALRRELVMVPNLDGTGFVFLDSRSSSDLSVAEMSDMIELMMAWGAREGVVWSDPQARAEAA